MTRKEGDGVVQPSRTEHGSECPAGERLVLCVPWNKGGRFPVAPEAMMDFYWAERAAAERPREQCVCTGLRASLGTKRATLMINRAAPKF